MDNNIALSTSEGYLRQQRMPIQARFVPLPDISAYEIATLLPFLLRAEMYEEDWEKLGTATGSGMKITPLPSHSPSK